MFKLYMSNEGIKWTIGTILVIIGIVVTILLNQPHISRTRQGDSTCPSTIYGSFNVKFSNSGAITSNMCVTASSYIINFTDNNDCLDIAKGKSTNFEFNVDKDTIPMEAMNISISYDYTYTRFLLGPGKGNVSCSYSKNQGKHSSLTLI